MEATQWVLQIPTNRSIRSRSAATARAAGIIIYCIGLIGADGIDVSVLNDWATDPDASHVAVTPDDSDLEDLFADLAANTSPNPERQIS